jgi:hypothetical protein
MTTPTTPQANPFLYAVAGYTGAHTATMREIHADPATDKPTRLIARVHLIGAIDPFEIELTDLRPFNPATDQYRDGSLYTTLAQEAAVIYGLDPARIHRAIEIINTTGAIMPAKYDEQGNAIPKPSYALMYVRATNGRGFYLVTKGTCTCPDHKNGHTCKHRIAAWMMREAQDNPSRKPAQTATQPATTPAKKDRAALLSELGY